MFASIPPRTRRIVATAGAIGALVLTAVLLVRTRDADGLPTGVGASTNTLLVQSSVAREESWPEPLDLFGNVVPWDEVVVSAQVAGQPLVEITARVGDVVHAGQVLARFDAALLRVEAQRLRAEMAQAEAELRQADAERDRALQLAEGGGVSQQEVLQRTTVAQVAAAQLDAARARLAASVLNLQRAVVVAPDAGTISARSAQTGQVGETGQELFRIIRRDRLEWRGEATAAQLERVIPGQRAVLSLPDGAEAPARVRHRSPGMDAKTRLATVYADIEPGSAARAGTYVAARVMLPERPALAMPAAGIVVRDGTSLAFSVTQDGASWRVLQRRVEIGRRSGADVEILAGLTAGERVVTQGAGFLEDGDLVRLSGVSP